MQKFSLSKHLRKIIPLLFAASLSFNAFAEAAFSGETEGNVSFSSDPTASEATPQLLLENYFLGQTLFTPNIWLRFGFTVDTENLFRPSALEATAAKFYLNEMSLNLHQNVLNSDNYFSIYYGNTDSCGTDIIFTRLFNLDPLSSAITHPATGYSHSLLFNQAGLGLSDTIRFQKPMALGVSAYINYNTSGYYIASCDLRFAGSYRFFSWDLKGGIDYSLLLPSVTLTTAPDPLYYHAGLTMLIGNSYTQSLFIQSGIAKGKFSSDSDFANNLFLLIEPRFNIGAVKAHLSFYTMPSETCTKSQVLGEALGTSINVFYDSTEANSSGFKTGVIGNLSFKDTNLLTMNKISEAFASKDYTVLLSPYFEGDVFESKIKVSANINMSKIFKGDIVNSTSLNAGWKKTF